jgi:hypothetical protein
MKTQLFIILSLVLININALTESKKGNLRHLDEIEYTMSNNVMELKTEHVITEIKWTKSGDYKYNYLLGVFEGANDPTFSDAVPIAMIKEQGNLNEVNIIDVNVPTYYKYIRYIPPNKNKTDISPIKLSGKLKSEINASDRKDFQVTNLPLVSIHVDNSVFPDTKDQEYNCKVVIINNGKIENNNEKATIKIRGKSTSMASDKRPYRLKFETKQKVLGLDGEYKKWTLIANFYDKSLLRNAVAFKISEIMGFDFTVRCNPVDVLLNGDYRGTYFLCDQMEVGKERINIDKMEKTDTTEPNLSGGYFLEVDGGGSFYHYTNFKTQKGIQWKINYPKEDDIAPEQITYITDKFNKFESEVYSGVLDSLDLDTYSKFFLVEEFCGDPDAVWSSCYFVKKRNDDKFYFGPVWDFDLGFDNDQRLTPTNDKPRFAFTYGASAGTMMDFTKTLVSKKTVIENVKKTWEKLCSSGLDEKTLIDFIEKKKEEIEESSTLNYMKWDNFASKGQGGWGMGGMGGFGRKAETFDAAVDRLKEYVKKRFTSLGNLIDTAINYAN